MPLLRSLQASSGSFGKHVKRSHNRDQNSQRPSKRPGRSASGWEPVTRSQRASEEHCLANGRRRRRLPDRQRRLSFFSLVGRERRRQRGRRSQRERQRPRGHPDV